MGWLIIILVLVILYLIQGNPAGDLESINNIAQNPASSFIDMLLYIIVPALILIVLSIVVYSILAHAGGKSLLKSQGLNDSDSDDYINKISGGL